MCVWLCVYKIPQYGTLPSPSLTLFFSHLIYAPPGSNGLIKGRLRKAREQRERVRFDIRRVLGTLSFAGVLTVLVACSRARATVGRRSSSLILSAGDEGISAGLGAGLTVDGEEMLVASSAVGRSSALLSVDSASSV